MKILVLGAGGMAGHVIATYLSDQTSHEIEKVYHKGVNGTLLDVFNREELDSVLNKFSCVDVIINCIGYVAVKNADLESAKAIYLNSWLPHYLENSCKENKIKLIHLSTDCVFSGRKGNYEEAAVTDGEGIYARSKALGDIINKKDLTLRTSIIGPELKENGTGLFHWFMTEQSSKVFGYLNVFWNGITTLELAKAIAVALDQELTGLYHLVPPETVSKYELLKLFNSTWNKGKTISEFSLSQENRKTLVDARKELNYVFPKYNKMLTDQKTWMNSYPHLYQQYL